jgi:hypothetical protein
MNSEICFKIFVVILTMILFFLLGMFVVLAVKEGDYQRRCEAVQGVVVHAIGKLACVKPMEPKAEQ